MFPVTPKRVLSQLSHIFSFMPNSLEERLVLYFQPEELEKAFYQYEKAKQDFFTTDVNICMGADGISYETFKREISVRCTIISHRVLNGTYQFYPFRQINIPKNKNLPESPDNERVLSISTIRDILVQKMLYKVVYEDIERLFQATNTLDRASCAYRNGKSAPYAAQLIHRYIQQGYTFVLDADIVKFFDEIPHQRMISLIKEVFVNSDLVSNLLLRFVKTGGVPYRDKLGKPYKKLFFNQNKPNRHDIKRKKGIPQGGVLSGMLANLYLYELDCWVVNELSQEYNLRYVRYADDFVILLKEEAAIAITHNQVAQKINNLGLRLHGEPKTKYVNLNKENENLEFVGFQFDNKNIRVRPKNIDKFKDIILDKIEEEPNYWREKRNPESRLQLFIDRVINRKILGRGEETCSVCGRIIGNRVRSWIGFFSVITDTTQLYYLDKWIRQRLYIHFYKEYKFRCKRRDLCQAGLASLAQEYYRQYRRKLCCCNLR